MTKHTATMKEGLKSIKQGSISDKINEAQNLINETILKIGSIEDIVELDELSALRAGFTHH